MSRLLVRNIRSLCTSSNLHKQLLSQIKESSEKSENSQQLFDQIDNIKNNSPDIMKSEIINLKNEISKLKLKNDNLYGYVITGHIAVISAIGCIAIGGFISNFLN